MKFIIFIAVVSFTVGSFGKLSEHVDMFPPGVKKLISRQAGRSINLREAKRKGWIGEANDGLLKIRVESKVSGKSLKKIEKLLRAENKDRLRILAKIKTSNKMNKVQYEDLVATYYRVHRNSSAVGTYYYDGKAWFRKQE